MKLSDYYSREVKKEHVLSIEKLSNGDYIEDVSSDVWNPLHLSQVVVNMNGKIYIINSKGIRQIKGKPTGRGVSLFKQYYDESGNIYEVQEQFHKGHIFQEVDYVGNFDFVDYFRTELNLEDETSYEAIASNDIWRD